MMGTQPMSIILKLLSLSFCRRQPAIRKRRNKNHLGNSNELRVPRLKLLDPFPSEIAFLFVSFLPFLEPKTPILIPSKKSYAGLGFKFQKTKLELPEYYAQILLALLPVQINTSHCCPWRGDKNSCRGGRSHPGTGSEADSLR